MRGLFTFRNRDSLMSCRFSRWSLLGCCISGVAQLTPDKPAGAHFLQRQACGASGSGSRFSSLFWQLAREGLNQGPWEQRLLTPLLSRRHLSLALSFSRLSQLLLRSRRICIFHRSEGCFFRRECALESTGRWACFTVMYKLCDSGWIRPTFFFFYFRDTALVAGEARGLAQWLFIPAIPEGAGGG